MVENQKPLVSKLTTSKHFFLKNGWWDGWKPKTIFKPYFFEIVDEMVLPLIKFNGCKPENHRYQTYQNHQNFFRNGLWDGFAIGWVQWLKTKNHQKFSKPSDFFRNSWWDGFLINLLTLWFCNEPILEEEFTSSILMVAWMVAWVVVQMQDSIRCHHERRSLSQVIQAH